MKKISLVALLALAACANPDEMFHRGLGDHRAARTASSFSVIRDSDGDFETGEFSRELTGSGLEISDTSVSLRLDATGRPGTSDYLLFTTTDYYFDDSTEFSRTRRVDTNLFETALGRRAIIANFTDEYTVQFYAENVRMAPIQGQATGEVVASQRRLDKFQVALGGGMMGLEFSDFGYWRALYYVRDENRNPPRFDGYDFQPIFGGNSNHLMTSGPGMTDGTFYGNAVALITLEGIGTHRFFDDKAIGGNASFDIASQTLTVNFDRWYTISFTATGTGNTATVNISNPNNHTLEDWSFANIGDRGDEGALNFQFFSPNPDSDSATEMVGGFHYGQSISPDEVLSITGGFGGMFGVCAACVERDILSRLPLVNPRPITPNRNL